MNKRELLEKINKELQYVTRCALTVKKAKRLHHEN
jgi:hypothetical protein